MSAEKIKVSKNPENGNPTGAVMVVGGGIAGVQAALDMANSGFFVYLVENSPAIGGVMAQLDKTFPTNDCSMCILSPKLVECGRHLNIQINTLSVVTGISGEPGAFKVALTKNPRYIDQAKCTGCGDCTEVCPVLMPDEFNVGLTDWKAAYRLYPQAIPAAFAIKKLDRAPCTLTCPAEINVQGYVQLIKMGKYKEAVRLIMERLPLPGVLGRICPHPCEDKCRRQELDEAVAICSLKRFAADQVDLSAISPPPVAARPEKVAIIGSGPAGLACAYHLALKGYRSTIFEALDQPGGMLRVGIPDYRLPKEILDREIDNILRYGVELRTNTALGRDFTLDGLFDQGYQAVFLGLGCHLGKPLGIPQEEAEGVIQGVEFLKKKNLGEPLTVGRRLAVIGGGNVAIDVACTARRLGSEVTIVYRRSREEMPAFHHEIEQALCEGVKIIYLAAPLKVLTGGDGKVMGLVCQKMELGEPDASGRRKPVPIPGAEFELPVDMVVPAIGQEAALGALADWDVKVSKWGTIEVDETTYQTSRPGVFAAGDVHTGPWTAIEAVGGGIESAESIDRYLRGADLAEGRVLGQEAHERLRELPRDEEGRPREVMQTLPPEHTCACFDEIALGFTEAQAQAEAARCINCGVCSECMECVVACKAGAVDHSQKPEAVELEVGAVILAPGFKAFDPHMYGSYGYGKYKNVITSMEFERILSATGPYEGHLVRPSDHQAPKKIAWLQCVGSRDTRPGAHGYCSGVCCMYAIKEAVIAKEHAGADLDTAIFFMDMRTYGKDFERYYNRAKDEAGVRFIRSRIHSITPAAPDSQDLKLEWVEENGDKKSEIFDLVVLSIGLEVGDNLRQLADNVGVALDADGFVDTGSFTPVATNRPGVYVCGAMAGPKDIPYSVMEASAAAAASASLLASSRGTLVREKTYPEELPVWGLEPRVGVFVCHCGINIAGVVDVPAVRDYARNLPNVAYVADNLFTCSEDTQKLITEAVKENQLNRVVVAACTPRTHEPLFQETIREAGLNPYLFEFANIRDQDSWVHQQEPELATEKAKDLVRMAVAKAALLEPLQPVHLDISQNALVIGGGLAGMTAALNLADQGLFTYLVEEKDELGGHARKVGHTWKGEDVGAYLFDLSRRVQNHEQIEVLTGAQVTQVKGFVGNFETTVQCRGHEHQIQHGAAILATGAHSLKPKEYLYGENDRVTRWHDLDKRFAEQPQLLKEAEAVAFIQCVGSREPERPYCSKICCTGSVSQAIALKKQNPDLQVYILYRDMRTYGAREHLYRQAREMGVVFIRYHLEDKPVVESATINGREKLLITVTDHILERPLKIPVDYLNLATAIIPKGLDTLAKFFKVPLNQDGFFLEAHMKLRPVDFATDGVFVCGLAHYPKPIEESIAQAQAAAARAASVLTKGYVEVEPIVSVVNDDLCIGCGLCEALCPFSAIRLAEIAGKGYRAENITAACKGCGVCSAACPQRAIDMMHFRDQQIVAVIHAGGQARAV